MILLLLRLLLLQEVNLDVTRDPLLGPLSDFRNECKNNPLFRVCIETLHSKSNKGHKTVFSASPSKTSSKTHGEDRGSFNSPLATFERCPGSVFTKLERSIVQETPIRKMSDIATQSLLDGEK